MIIEIQQHTNNQFWWHESSSILLETNRCSKA